MTASGSGSADHHYPARMRRLVLVANPTASGFTAVIHREVVALLSAGYRVTPVWPESPEGARLAAAEAAEAGYEVVAAMGGDGVVHQVANGLLSGATSMAVIPAGTTNVLARIIGYPPDPRDAAAAVARSSATRQIPVASVTTDSALGIQERLATFAAGVGFDAAVIRRAEQTPLAKVDWGPIHYARNAAGLLWSDYRRRRPHLRVTAGRRSADAVTVMVQLHDVFTYFGPAPLHLAGDRGGPGAAVIARLTTLRLLRLLAGAARRRDLSRVPGVQVWTGFDSLTVEADPPAWAEADGELLGRASRVTIAPHADGISIIDTGPRPPRRRFRVP